NKVIALDAETGTERWSFDPEAGDTKVWNRCRGVSWYDAPEDLRAADGKCGTRIITTAKNSRLYALDAATGEPCANFGENGEVDLSRVGMGSRQSGYHEVSARTRGLQPAHAQRLFERPLRSRARPRLRDARQAHTRHLGRPPHSCSGRLR